MNDPLEHVRELAARARREEAPQGHVASKVLRRLREESLSVVTRQLSLFAALTGVLALAAVLLIAASVDVSAADPLGTFFQVAAGPKL